MAVPTKPRRWTLALKLALAVFVLALVPQIVVAVINVGEVRSALEERERQALARRAVEASRRLEERVGRLSAYSELLATHPDLVGALSEQPVRPGRGSASVRSQLWIERAQDWDATHEHIYELLVSVRRANPWFQHAYLLDANGLCVASSERESKPDMVGRVYDYRPYYRAPMADQEPYVTDVLKNANSPGTAIFVSAPVIRDDRVAGVVVIKIDTAALHDVVADLSRRGGRTLLVDRFGVVVSDARDGETIERTEDGSLQFHALASVDRYRTLFEDTKRYGDPAKENYLDRVSEPLGLEALWQRLRSGGSDADLYAFPVEPSGSTEPTMVGYAVVLAAPTEPYGYIVVAEPASEFRESLEQLAGASVLRSILVVGGVALVLAILLGRLSRRLGRLVDGTRRVTRGETSLRIDDQHGDELGEIASNFDKMADKLSTTLESLQRRDQEVQQAQRGAERARKASQTLMSQVAERLAGPLASATEASRTLRDTIPRDETADAALSSIDEATSAMRGVVDEVHTLTGSTELAAELTDVDALVRRVVESARSLAASSSTKLELRTDAALGEGTVDRIKLRQILSNLLDNACRYTREGEVIVTATRHPDALEVRVADTGVGMTRGQIERFESASSADIDPDDDAWRLVVSRLAATAMQGALSVRSAAGEGTTFTLRVPVEWTG